MGKGKNNGKCVSTRGGDWCTRPFGVNESPPPHPPTHHILQGPCPCDAVKPKSRPSDEN